MKKIIQKMIMGLLSVTTLVAGVFSFGSLKQETAFADTEVSAWAFTDANIEAFAYNIGMNMELYSQTSFFLVDSQFFNGETIGAGATYAGLEDEPFFAGLTDALLERINFVDDPGDVMPSTVAEIFAGANIEVIVHIHDSNNSSHSSDYVRLTDGGLMTVTNAAELISALYGYYGFNCNVNDVPYYAAIVYPYDQDFYDALYSLQMIRGFEVYLFPKRSLTLGDDGLVVWCRQGTNNSETIFTTGFRWRDGVSIG